MQSKEVSAWLERTLAKAIPALCLSVSPALLTAILLLIEERLPKTELRLFVLMLLLLLPLVVFHFRRVVAEKNEKIASLNNEILEIRNKTKTEYKLPPHKPMSEQFPNAKFKT